LPPLAAAAAAAAPFPDPDDACGGDSHLTLISGGCLKRLSLVCLTRIPPPPSRARHSTTWKHSDDDDSPPPRVGALQLTTTPVKFINPGKPCRDAETTAIVQPIQSAKSSKGCCRSGGGAAASSGVRARLDAMSQASPWGATPSMARLRCGVYVHVVLTRTCAPSEVGDEEDKCCCYFSFFSLGTFFHFSFFIFLLDIRRASTCTLHNPPA
jgi:hypothetical protein